MTVRAKLRLRSFIGPDQGNSGIGLIFETQYSPEIPEDQSFQKYTPWGTITVDMVIDNPKALEQFKIGEYYYVDFTKI